MFGTAASSGRWSSSPPGDRLTFVKPATPPRYAEQRTYTITVKSGALTSPTFGNPTATPITSRRQLHHHDRSQYHRPRRVHPGLCPRPETPTSICRTARATLLPNNGMPLSISSRNSVTSISVDVLRPTLLTTTLRPATSDHLSAAALTPITGGVRVSV